MCKHYAVPYKGHEQLWTLLSMGPGTDPSWYQRLTVFVEDEQVHSSKSLLWNEHHGKERQTLEMASSSFAALGVPKMALLWFAGCLLRSGLGSAARIGQAGPGLYLRAASV